MTGLDQQTSAISNIKEEASKIGARVFAHAIDIDTGVDAGIDAEHPVVTASVFKVPVLAEYVRQVSIGDLDPRTRIVVKAADATPGPTGLSVFNDDADWSLRDIATSMITVSDNTATDIVCRLVGIDRVNALMESLGLSGTKLVGDCVDTFASINKDLDLPMSTPDEDLEQVMRANAERVPSMAICTPSATNRTTPRDATRLLELLWTDKVASPDACAQARAILGKQVWTHRLSSGFPDDAIRVSGKTGTIGIVRNEIGVVEYPDGRRYAVAIFVRTGEMLYRNPAADRLIGTAARLLVDRLSLAAHTLK
ncbi:serine hydrolase [Jatrophihabitans sp. DSM 45814]